MNSSQLREASTRAEPLVKLMPKPHALPKSCVLSPLEANRVSYMTACPRVHGGCVVQMCHTIWVYCGQAPGHAVASFFSALFFFALFEEDCFRAMGTVSVNGKLTNVDNQRFEGEISPSDPRLQILLWCGDDLIQT
ncbi:hypothetical protein M413DRAFT_153107 [Hebeloma cylindrosporum]|uniref:Uncharacterized protein n=1 Tax=Hebeloma cylindrosporum TaxID=76867 RepID=A0A0C2X9E9_HEBCY|nr:hypothetical protein M413DRAFT_153107 [Hebeloma cylindrosporum h7]